MLNDPLFQKALYDIRKNYFPHCEVCVANNEIVILTGIKAVSQGERIIMDIENQMLDNPNLQQFIKSKKEWVNFRNNVEQVLLFNPSLAVAHAIDLVYNENFPQES